MPNLPITPNLSPEFNEARLRFHAELMRSVLTRDVDGIAEPLPSRIASLALGTGDLDCVYHMALPELCAAAAEIHHDEATEMLEILVSGKRLKDISDLPLDLAV